MLVSGIVWPGLRLSSFCLAAEVVYFSILFLDGGVRVVQGTPRYTVELTSRHSMLLSSLLRVTNSRSTVRIWHAYGLQDEDRLHTERNVSHADSAQRVAELPNDTGTIGVRSERHCCHPPKDSKFMAEYA